MGDFEDFAMARGSCLQCGKKYDARVRDRCHAELTEARLRRPATIHQHDGMYFIHWEDDE